MLKRIRIGDLQPADLCVINGRRFKVYGKVIRDGQVFIAVYEERLDHHKRKFSYLEPDVEVLHYVK